MTNETTPQTPAGRPQGDTGHGTTGVPNDELGISNRPGDRDEQKRRASTDEQERRRS